MVYTQSDYKKMRQSLDVLKKMAEPLFSSLSAIEAYDSAIANAFTLLNIQQEQAPTTKKSGKNTNLETSIVHDLKMAHSFISLALAHDTGPQFKQLLSDQLIMQRDMLDMLREIVEKRTAVTIPILEIPENDDLNITEQDRKLSLAQLNEVLSENLHIDDATIVSQLNKFRTARETTMEHYVIYLTTALTAPATQPGKVPTAKKVHIFSRPAKEANTNSIHDLLTNIINGAREVQDMAEYLITKVPAKAADRLQLELKKSDDIADNATLLAANEQLSALLRLTNIIQLANDLLHNYTRVVQEEQNATIGPRFSRHMDRAFTYINQLPQSVALLVDTVLAESKESKQYKAEDFAEIKRRVAELQKLSTLRAR